MITNTTTATANITSPLLDAAFGNATLISEDAALTMFHRVAHDWLPAAVLAANALLLAPAPASALALQRNRLVLALARCGGGDANTTAVLDYASNPTRLALFTGGDRRLAEPFGAVVANFAIVAGVAGLYSAVVLAMSVLTAKSAEHHGSVSQDASSSAGARASSASEPSERQLLRALKTLQRQRRERETGVAEDAAADDEAAESDGGARTGADDEDGDADDDESKHRSDSSGDGAAVPAQGSNNDGDDEDDEDDRVAAAAVPSWYVRLQEVSRAAGYPGCHVNLGVVFAPVLASSAASILTHAWEHGTGVMIATAIALPSFVALYLLFHVHAICAQLRKKATIIVEDAFPWLPARTHNGNIVVANNNNNNNNNNNESATASTTANPTEQQAPIAITSRSELVEFERFTLGDQHERDEEHDEGDADEEEEEEEAQQDEHEEPAAADDDEQHNTAAAMMSGQYPSGGDGEGDGGDDGPKLTCWQRAQVFFLGRKAYVSSDLTDRYRAIIAYDKRGTYALLFDLVTSVAVGALCGTAALPLQSTNCLSVAITTTALLLAHLASLTTVFFPLLLPIEAVACVIMSAVSCVTSTIAIIAIAKRIGEEGRQRQLERTGEFFASRQAIEDAADMRPLLLPLFDTVAIVAATLALVQILAQIRRLMRWCCASAAALTSTGGASSVPRQQSKNSSGGRRGAKQKENQPDVPLTAADCRARLQALIAAEEALEAERLRLEEQARREREEAERRRLAEEAEIRRIQREQEEEFLPKKQIGGGGGGRGASARRRRGGDDAEGAATAVAVATAPPSSSSLASSFFEPRRSSRTTATTGRASATSLASSALDAAFLPRAGETIDTELLGIRRRGGGGAAPTASLSSPQSASRRRTNLDDF